jgi:hypothetical protein
MACATQAPVIHAPSMKPWKETEVCSPQKCRFPWPSTFERCLPWTIHGIAPQRERRTRPVHTESTDWTVGRCSARENGVDLGQRLQHPGFWRPGSHSYAPSPAEKREENARGLLLPTRRIPQTLQAVICISGRELRRLT